MSLSSRSSSHSPSNGSCVVTCALAAGFFVAMLIIIMNPYKQKQLAEFLLLLSPEQILTYQRIHRERLHLYIVSLVMGLLLGFIYLQYAEHEKQVIKTCVFIVIVMGVNYLFYMLYPKSTMMIYHLTTENQIKEYKKIQRNYQFKYYFGMTLGILSYVFISLV